MRGPSFCDRQALAVVQVTLYNNAMGTTAATRGAKKGGGQAVAEVWLKRVWLILTDHSVGGVSTTKRGADSAIRLRANGTDGTVFMADYLVAGPYVLQERKPKKSRGKR